MGVAINYRGRLVAIEQLPSLRDDLRGLAKSRGWSHVEFPSFKANRDAPPTATPDRDEPDLSGITIVVHEKCEPLLLLFAADGVLRNPSFSPNDTDGAWCSVKTQYAPVEAHIAIVEILRRIEPRFSELEVVDEGQYWESRDRELLVANLKALANLLDATEQALKTAPPGQGPLDERIIAAMSNLGRDIKPN